MVENAVEMRQIQQFWNMLEEMSSTNPQGYKSFIDKQLKEGIQNCESERPKFDITIRSTYNNSLNNLIFVNIFGWSKIPLSKNDSEPISLCDGVMMDIDEYSNKTQTQQASMVSVAFHPEVLKKYGSESHQRDVFFQLALDSIEQSHHIDVDRNYAVLNKCAGTKEQALKSLMDGMHKKKPAQKTPHESTNLYEDVIQLSKNKEASNLDEALSDDVEFVLGANSNAGKKSKVLIEEIQENHPNSLKTPTHKQVVVEREGRRVVQMKVWLPGVRSVEQCLLEVSEDDVLLEANNEYFLVLELVSKVHSDAVEASFDIQKGCLTVLLPCLEEDS